MQKATRIIVIVALALLLVAFGAWLFTGAGTLHGVLAAAAAVALFGLCGAWAVPAMFFDFAGREARLLQPGPRSMRFWRQHPWVQVAALVLASRIALLVLAYAITVIGQGYSGGLVDTLRSVWVRSDANSYLGIAENWYVTEGDPRFHIVFFPLYPIVVRVFMFITGGSFSAALLVSNLAAAAAGCVAYELFRLDMPREGALRAVKFLFLLPAGFFLCAPMTESLFLLLSLLAVLLARKGRFLFAALVAALAAFTRSVGVLLLIPLGVEFACHVLKCRREGRLGRKKALLQGLSLAIVPLGLGAYVLINYLVTGEPFKFMQYQQEHWSQGFGWFFATSGYQAEYFARYLAEGQAKLAWGLSMPNLVCCFASLGLMAAAAKRLRGSYTIYFLGYYFVAIGVTWLLSAPRYLTVMFPLAAALAMLARGRTQNAVLTIGLAAAQIGYLAMFVLGWPVY